MNEKKYRPIKLLSEQTAKKIAAGEVIERPASVVRELLDNAIDAGAENISVELVDGGITEITVIDDGFGMSEADLAICTETHSTSKIENIDDLLLSTTLGFRGEALASINAVSDLEIISTQAGPLAWKFFAEHISKTTLNKGTSVSAKNIFNNFPARKKFLKLPATEAKMCKQAFLEKALANPHITMQLKNNGNDVLSLKAVSDFKRRVMDAFHLREPEECFYEINMAGSSFSGTAVLGIPDVAKANRQMMYIFANGRRIDEYGFLQAVDYGAEPFFPNGTHPVAFVFLSVDPSAIDFNIHPAKREARFASYSEIHKVISSAVARFYKAHTIATLKAGFQNDESAPAETGTLLGADFSTAAPPHDSENFQKRSLYEKSIGGGFHFSDQAAQNKTFSVADAAARYQKSGLSNREFRPVDVPAATNFKFLGQVAGTFVAVEKNNDIYFIDQHAAHERILFERLKESARDKQELLVPYRIETESDEEETKLKSLQPKLAESGFEMEQMSANVWSVSTVPCLWVGTEAELSADIKKAAAENLDLLHEVLAMSACRAACKDGDILSPEAAFDLAQKTFQLPEPLCPHGRPLWVVVTREELFKRIKRT